MKPDELAFSLAVGLGLLLLAKSGALAGVGRLLGHALIEFAPPAEPELSQHAKEARAYELARRVIERARTP
jgi:hypothetical protein